MKPIRNSDLRLILGRNPVREALRSDIPIEKIAFAFGVRGGAIDQIRQLARQRGIPTSEMAREKFNEVSGGVETQGVIAFVGQKQYVEVEDILTVARERNEQPFLLVLDEIEDPQNLGALIRTAECAGVHGVVIPRHHAAGITAATVRASAGASEHIAIARVSNIASCLDVLKENGIWIVGTAAEVEKSFTELDYTMSLAIVIGSEGRGMRKLVREKCDFLVKIPIFGKTASLNASVAGALVMYEVVRGRASSPARIPIFDRDKSV